MINDWNAPGSLLANAWFLSGCALLVAGQAIYEMNDRSKKLIRRIGNAMRIISVILLVGVYLNELLP